MKIKMLIYFFTGFISQILYLEVTHCGNESKDLGIQHLSWNSCSTNSLDACPKKLLNLGESQFPQQHMRDNNADIMRLFGGPNDIISVAFLV